MNKAFNPSIKEVTSIGDELRFQREYYCYKNNVSLPLKIDSSIKENDERDSLQDVLYNYMQNNIGENSEMATSYDVLYAIENGKSKKKNENYNPNSYFLRMFCLFKIYGFLDSITIIELLKNKYKLTPNFESSKKMIREIEDECYQPNKLLTRERGKLVNINIAYRRIFISKELFLKMHNVEEQEKVKKELEEMEKKLKEDYPYKYEYKNGELIKKVKEDEPMMYEYDFSEELNLLKDKLKSLSIIERYCTALELGQDTLYIQNIINGTLQNIHIETMIKTLQYFKMDNGKFYNLLLEIKNQLTAETIKFNSAEAL